MYPNLPNLKSILSNITFEIWVRATYISVALAIVTRMYILHLLFEFSKVTRTHSTFVVSEEPEALSKREQPPLRQTDFI